MVADKLSQNFTPRPPNQGVEAVLGGPMSGVPIVLWGLWVTRLPGRT